MIETTDEGGDHFTVIVRRVSDEANQRPWVAAPLPAARDDINYFFASR